MNRRLRIYLALTLTALWLPAVGVVFAQSASAPAPVPLPPDAPKPPYKRLVGPETLNPGDYPAHFPYPDEYDSAVAASEVHHVRYVDAHVRLVEVAYFPGVHGQMHGHPFPSVFAIDSPLPNSYNILLDPQNKILMGRGIPPKGMDYPFCRTMNPQSPHAETNQDTWPHHFYRLEFFRIDGKDIEQHWKEWYPAPNNLVAASGLQSRAGITRFSEAWPYPISFDTIRAAPNNQKLLYEDAHIRLVEVTVRPGEAEPFEGDPYPSIIASDTLPGAGDEDVAMNSSLALDPESVRHTPPPPGFDLPVCSTSAPLAPHSIRNKGAAAIHYYRIDFKRIDGNGIKTHWREWYPWMAKLTDEYKEHPYVSNYF